MTKEDYKDFTKSTKYWTCDNDYVDNDNKLRDNCHITGKYKAMPIEIVISILN